MQKSKLYIVRRESRGIGGAEKVAHRFLSAFSAHFDTIILDSDELSRMNDPASKQGGPGWLKAWRFAKDADRFLASVRSATVLSMERGVGGDAYRFGDGVHKVWLRKRYRSPLGWITNPLHWVLPVLEKKSVRQSKTLVPNSRMIAAQIESHYKLEPDRVRVIRNGYDGKTFAFADDRERGRIKNRLKAEGHDRLNVLFSGSGWQRKGLHSSITMLHHLRSTGINASLWVAGKGDPRPYASTIKSLGLSEKVIFLGQVPQINLWYQMADLMILPTAYDPFSNSCLEALACGCPVLTTSSNGAAEVITSASGFIARSPDDCAKKNAVDWALQARSLDRKKISLSVTDSLQESEIDQYLKILTKDPVVEK
jgi:UDP-glucose:(heptosyl)LPS alpha-1,3-glucosyltransferase